MSKTTFKTDAFRKALALASQATPKASPLPIITMVRVRFASISGNDTKTQITAPVDGEGSALDVCLSPEKLRAAAEVAGETISLTVKGSTCEVASGKHKFRLPCVPGEDYPVMKVGEAVAEFDSTAQLHDTLSRVANMAAENTDVRYYMRGVRMENDAQALTLIATNGAAMAYRSIDLKPPQPFACIVPTAACLTLAKTSPGRWTVTDRQVIVCNDDAEFIFTLVEGTYPMWQRVQVQGDSGATVRYRELDEIVKLATRMSENRKVAGMMLTQDGESLMAETPQASDGGGLDTSIELTECTGRPIRVGVDMNLMAKAMKCIQVGQPVRIVWRGTADGETLQSSLGLESDDGMRTVVMPMRI